MVDDVDAAEGNLHGLSALGGNGDGLDGLAGDIVEVEGDGVIQATLYDEGPLTFGVDMQTTHPVVYILLFAHAAYEQTRDGRGIAACAREVGTEGDGARSVPLEGTAVGLHLIAIAKFLREVGAAEGVTAHRCACAQFIIRNLNLFTRSRHERKGLLVQLGWSGRSCVLGHEGAREVELIERGIGIGNDVGRAAGQTRIAGVVARCAVVDLIVVGICIITTVLAIVIVIEEGVVHRLRLHALGRSSEGDGHLIARCRG